MSQFWSTLELRSRSKSVANKNELTTNGYTGHDLATSEQIDVLSSMYDGTRLLKLCSRRTRSHWRKFQLDSNNRSIRWVSDKKDVNDTTICIKNIVEIICHSIDIVKKFKDTLPEELSKHNDELQQQQFTIRYVEYNNNKHFLPSLSPNHSLTNTMHQSLSIIQPPLNNLSLQHQSKNSNSFIRSLHHQSKNSKVSLIQPDYTDNESVTDSGSNHKNDKKNKTTFWKKWLKKEKEQSPHDQQQHHHERNYTDSTKLTLNNGYQYHELHLMAENPRIATIWIYGLERLIEVNKNGIDLSIIPSSQFKISTKELMNYSIDKGRSYNNNKSCYNLFNPFKINLDRINNGLYNIIEQLPSSQQLLLEDNKININNIDQTLQNNYLMRKIRQDQNDLDYIIHQVSKERFDKENLKRWSYILERIEINIGGYQIALNNQKQIEQNYDHHQHKRERSKSSSITVLQHSSFQLHQQQHSNSKHHKITRSFNNNHQRNNILKDRSPRSPQTLSSDTKLDDLNILPAPISPHPMEKYDSI